MKITYNELMQLPFRCVCGEEQMVDMEHMEIRVVSKLLKVEGFTCTHGQWNPVFYTTVSLEEQFHKLDRMPVTHRNYRYYFAKTLRKAAGVQKRMAEHGAL